MLLLTPSVNQVLAASPVVFSWDAQGDPGVDGVQVYLGTTPVSANVYDSGLLPASPAQLGIANSLTPAGAVRHFTFWWRKNNDWNQGGAILGTVGIAPSGVVTTPIPIEIPGYPSTTMLDRVMAHFVPWWEGGAPIAHQGGVIAPPRVLAENGSWRPSTGERHVCLWVLSDGEELVGTAATLSGRATGVLQLDMVVAPDEGTRLFSAMRDRFAAWCREAWRVVPGLRVYGVSLPSPLDYAEGWYANLVRAEFTWTSPQGQP